MTNPTRPFPAIVNKELRDLVYNCTGVDYSTEEMAFISGKLTGTTQAIIQAVRQLVEDGMPAKKTQVLDLDEDNIGDFEEAHHFCTTCGQYQFDDPFICYCTIENQAIDQIRSTLLEGLGDQP